MFTRYTLAFLALIGASSSTGFLTLFHTGYDSPHATTEMAIAAYIILLVLAPVMTILAVRR